MIVVTEFFRRIGTRLRASFSTPPAPPEQLHGQARTDAIASLRTEISRLQQELLTLSPNDGGATPEPARRGTDREIVALEQSLSQAQQKLSTYQGRI